MHVHVLGQHESALGLTGLTAALNSLGLTASHDVLTGPTVSDAADLGHALAERWAAAAPDVVYASGWLAGLAAQIGTRNTGTPVVQRLFAPGRSRQPERQRLEGAIARGAARTIAVCSGDVDRLVALGVRRSDVRVVPHGVDTSVFGDEGPVWPAADGRRLVARPGTDQAVTEQLVALLPLLPRCEVVLLTTPATRPAASLGVSAAVAHHPVGHRVRLLDLDETMASGAAATGTLPALLRSADVVVAFGDDEPELDLALQAMACGVPVVARATGGMAEVVADGVTGTLVSSATSESLADAVRALVSDDLRRESLGLAAGDRARASFDWAPVATAVARVAREVAADGEGRPADVLHSG